ncbi:MAG: hypothetical protein U9R51_01075 [Actinomycetota bacterium]|nr:hypothetical protein [Actinomycetota bacterium]
MDLIIEYVRDQPGLDGIATSYVPLTGGPGEFCHLLGFGDSGAEDGDTIVPFLLF